MKKEISIIHSLDEIPTSFASEDEEREWWATHELSDELYEQLPDYTQEHRQWQKITRRKSDLKIERRENLRHHHHSK